VAVAGWEWCHSKEEINAVRMVSVRAHGSINCGAE
jgi:hypothetical protein